MRYRPRRSCLYLPGANPKAIDKAKSLPADVLIFDLEDSVAPDAKTQARESVIAALEGAPYGAREIVVRINGLSTDWGLDDVKALAGARLDAILIPKIETGADIIDLDDAMTSAGYPETAGLWVMIETPRAILSLKDIAEAARATRLQAFVLGLNDLGKEMRAKPGLDRAPFHAAMALAVTAARAHALVCIDGVYNDIQNIEGFEAECRQGAHFGFDGKSLIHPAQIELANLVFAPSPDEIAQARALIAAFALPENQGRGVIKHEGRMAELLHLAEAERIVAMAEAIADRR